MKTSSKLRRLRRIRKLRRQRSIAFFVIVILVVTMAHAAFSKSLSDKSYCAMSVVVQKGDTLWSIAKENMPKGANLCEYVYEISANNGIKDGNIYCGQTIFVPVRNF